MEKLIDVLPIIMLSIGQLMLALFCMNQSRQIKMLKEMQNAVIEAAWEVLTEVRNGQQK